MSTDISNVAAALPSDTKAAVTTIATYVDSIADVAGQYAGVAGIARMKLVELIAELNRTVGA